MISARKIYEISSLYASIIYCSSICRSCVTTQGLFCIRKLFSASDILIATAMSSPLQGDFWGTAKWWSCPFRGNNYWKLLILHYLNYCSFSSQWNVANSEYNIRFSILITDATLGTVFLRVSLYWCSIKN